MGRITGTVTWVNTDTDRLVERRVRPFTVPDDTPWVDIVDEAADRTQPRGKGHWDLEDDSHLRED